jgi:hypothetical protein
MGWLKTLTVVLCLQLLGCNSSGGNDKDEAFQLGKYVFAVVFENYAWGEQKKGIYIDKDGKLYRYDISSMQLNSILNEKSLTSAQMDTYFTVTPNLEESITSQIMAANVVKLQQAKSGTLAAETQECNDAGTYVYLGFEYNQALDSYTPITLYRTGDHRQENTQAQALELKSWLVEKALAYQIAYELDPEGNNWCSGM